MLSSPPVPPLHKGEEQTTAFVHHIQEAILRLCAMRCGKNIFNQDARGNTKKYLCEITVTGKTERELTKKP